MIIKDIMECFYNYWMQSLIFALLMSIFMFYYKTKDLKGLAHGWLEDIKYSKVSKWRLIFFFYMYMVAMRTLFDRNSIWNGFENLNGGWGITHTGFFDYEAPENVIMFIPLFLLLYVSFPKLIRDNKWNQVLGKSLYIGFLISLFIECNQVIFGIGTFQFADLTYNTLGGMIGCAIYLLGVKISKYNRIQK